MTMQIQENRKYNTRSGHIATITDEISKFDRIYRYRGYVEDMEGKMVRSICLWMASGHYVLDIESDFDLVSEL